VVSSPNSYKITHKDSVLDSWERLISVPVARLMQAKPISPLAEHSKSQPVTSFHSLKYKVHPSPLPRAALNHNQHHAAPHSAFIHEQKPPTLITHKAYTFPQSSTYRYPHWHQWTVSLPHIAPAVGLSSKPSTLLTHILEGSSPIPRHYKRRGSN